MKNSIGILCVIFALFTSIMSGQEFKKVTVFWDVSASMEQRSLEKEFYFLDAYFKDIQQADVTLLTFSSQVTSKHNLKVANGQWDELKQTLETLKYDGGTTYESLETYSNGGDVLLFSDGNQNLGNATPNFDGELYLVNSQKDFNRANLNLLAIVNDGNLVNLVENRSIKDKKREARIYTGSVHKGTVGLPNVQVYIQGDQTNAVKSDDSGSFKIQAMEGDTLIVTHDNTKNQHVLGNQVSLNFNFKDDGIELDEVVVTERLESEVELANTGYGTENKEKLGYAVQSITDKEISDIATTGSNAILGKFSGVQLGQNDDLSQIKMRPSNSILGNNYGLIVIDGIPMSQTKSASAVSSLPFTGEPAPISVVNNARFIDPKNIAEITVLKGLAATNRFGSMGANGVLLITTKTAKVHSPNGQKKDLARLTNNIYDGKIKVNNKTLVTPYLRELKKGKNVQEAYDIYLQQRNIYSDNPEYLLDVYTFFHSSSVPMAERILSNILEKENPAYGELRGMYLKTTDNGNPDLALLTAQRMLEMYPNKIQSYFDFGMANKTSGNYQEALNMFNAIVDGSANPELNFEGMEKTVGTEIRNMVNKKRQQLDVTRVDQKYQNNLTYNARLVLDWNNTDAEFVVQFVNPQKRFFNWEHTETGDRKRILDELQHGFSTEQFSIVGADTIGDWILNVTYLGNRTAANTTPTFLKCTVQYNFGKPNQRNEDFLVRLHENGSEQQLAKFTVQ